MRNFKGGLVICIASTLLYGCSSPVPPSYGTNYGDMRLLGTDFNDHTLLPTQLNFEYKKGYFNNNGVSGSTPYFEGFVRLEPWNRIRYGSRELSVSYRETQINVLVDLSVIGIKDGEILWEQSINEKKLSSMDELFYEEKLNPDIDELVYTQKVEASQYYTFYSDGSFDLGRFDHLEKYKFEKEDIARVTRDELIPIYQVEASNSPSERYKELGKWQSSFEERYEVYSKEKFTRSLKNYIKHNSGDIIALYEAFTTGVLTDEQIYNLLNFDSQATNALVESGQMTLSEAKSYEQLLELAKNNQQQAKDILGSSRSTIDWEEVGLQANTALVSAEKIAKQQQEEAKALAASKAATKTTPSASKAAAPVSSKNSETAKTSTKSTNEFGYKLSCRNGYDLCVTYQFTDKSTYDMFKRQCNQVSSCPSDYDASCNSQAHKPKSGKGLVKFSIYAWLATGQDPRQINRFCRK